MRYPRLCRRLSASFILAAVLFSSCASSAPENEAAAQQKPYFRPPAPEVTATSASAVSSGQQAISDPANQAAAGCLNNLTFLKDVSIPDGTPVTSRATMDKRWEVENSGSCGWNENYRMRLIAGPSLGVQPEQALYPARSGSHAVLRILFQAPDEPGAYRSAWQAHSAEGEPFGDPFFIDIVVEEAGYP